MAEKKLDRGIVRWLRIGVRSAHILAFSLYLGGVFWGINSEQLSLYLAFVGITGTAMMGLFFLQKINWLLQNRGLVILAKILILLCIPFFENYRFYALTGILIGSSLIAHAPSTVRYYSILLGKRLDN
ncbi:MAG: hypothetical protein A2508_10625 [Candidatus Lambdaproteobacteria bacterium RIFOXYD12_FULL_49_8]|uniref:Uncharacterized protein n=1 Tax=Candidatus Lambdaproteobacteria bacterium RIFOXYD2_FULL_50_16 TaxID=1817772 RepID=A0A1F6G593_9PROT|nr:MAG: hypothetical protein A2527_13610 [Candidatus Lambdaproteobacteria bacterium RIFOXYD2_FULL_50_16]OGG97405.1 MAG: hypothetical protein A2508_10625 [Candidatus Lambdaproteobacteria bacterium RIFOXYD12_FULL_49_8]